MFKQFISRPIWSLLLFFVITIAIWVGGKFYSPSIVDAKPYQGGQVELSENGNLVIAEGLVTHSGNSRQGIRFLTIKGQQGEFGTTFFPSHQVSPHTVSISRSTSLLDTLSSRDLLIIPITTETLKVRMRNIIRTDFFMKYFLPLIINTSDSFLTRL